MGVSTAAQHGKGSKFQGLSAFVSERLGKPANHGTQTALTEVQVLDV